MTILEKLKNGRLILDGAMGTQLQEKGLPLGTLPEEWNLSRPEVITAIHSSYFQAGADAVCTNTFGANYLKFGDRLEQVVSAAVKCAKSACGGVADRSVLLDIGPCGKMLKPLGDMEFEDAVSLFKRTVEVGVKAGVDGVLIETMNDVYELKAAVIAAKEACSLPIFASVVFGADAKTMTGTSPEAFVTLAEGLGVAALGVNCSLSPEEMLPVIERMSAVSSTPLIVKPNAGLPKDEGGKTVYSVSAEQFAAQMVKAVKAGARAVGGCCGTSPEYIKNLCAAIEKEPVKPIENKGLCCVSSYTHTRYFGDIPVLIGERINPTGKKILKQALKDNDIAYILNEAVTQAEKGAHVLDVNVGLPEIDEVRMLERCVQEIQAVCDLPLQIDTSNVSAMERAMRVYNGIPLVNSVNGKEESMQAVFPLIKKYGGVAICLTLDENGIPATAAGRVEIAKKIIKKADSYGILRGQLIFDTLAMAVSADQNAAIAALDALEIIRRDLGCNTSLGVSNISFGLPQRDFINSTFFAMALTRGLSAAIYNPNSQEMTKTYRAFMALAGKDKNCAGYVDYASNVSVGEITANSVAAKSEEKRGGLTYCIVKGLKEEACAEADRLLETLAPLEVINAHVIPALDEVGKGFENKSVFLPQLLMSAEAAGAAFKVIKRKLNPSDNAKKLVAVLATVEGDIHDIGKNIVVTLLENYGFRVIDLGKDVSPERVIEAAKESGAQLIGLSALMTTTVTSMKRTVELAKEQLPAVKVCVGGAVLNAEYAEKIGADKYCKDAMETVRYAELLESKLCE
ncbi:MAG: homocysteine S-methyltransferase family protein [Clostridia bacterium]|nr:homocysteine S-methyltransferase family protein [Clostridia bacterium]